MNAVSNPYADPFKEGRMETEKRSCCIRAAGWALVGIVIALAWGGGNYANGMSAFSAFAIPGLIVLAIIGFVVLGALNLPWFNKLCNCQTSDDEWNKKRGAVGTR